MQIIINFINGIANAVTTFFDYLLDFMRSMLEVLELLTYFTANIPLYFSWLPSEYVTLIVLAFGVAVTYKILGREG